MTTHIPPLPDDFDYGYSFAPAPRKRASSPRNRPCAHRAPCGKPCAQWGHHPHQYHSCRDETCEACHGRDRFQSRGGAR